MTAHPSSKPRLPHPTRGWSALALLLLAAAMLAAPAAVHPEPTPAEIEANRRRVAELHKNPEQLQKLRAEAAAYFALPEERRQQIAEIDEGLARQPRPVQQRLTGVLDRYTNWLETLDEASRKRLTAAPDRKTRLALIRELREQEWIRNQPQAVQAELQKLQGDAYAKRLAELKRDERQRKLEWTVAGRFWNELETKQRLPTRVEELPQTAREPMREYVREYLLPALTDEEKDRLEKAKGQWPQFPMTLVAIAAKYPPALPGTHGPKSLKELPQDIRVLLMKDERVKVKKDFDLLAKVYKLKDGTWPEFGTRLANHAKSRGLIFPHEFLAYNEDCLAPAMKQFLNKTLLPVLDADQKLRLAGAILKWPEYPRTIQELAEAHQLEPPWYTLPRQEYWDGYRLDIARP
jgi:hypothetical protein